MYVHDANEWRIIWIEVRRAAVGALVWPHEVIVVVEVC